MNPQTNRLPPHATRFYDAGLTDSETITRGLDAPDYLTRRLAQIADRLERDKLTEHAEWSDYP